MLAAEHKTKCVFIFKIGLLPAGPVLICRIKALHPCVLGNEIFFQSQLCHFCELYKILLKTLLQAIKRVSVIHKYTYLNKYSLPKDQSGMGGLTLKIQ